MLVEWRDIAVFLDASPVGEKVGRHAARLARKHKAHLIGMYGVARPHGHGSHESFARGHEAIRQVLEAWRTAEENKVLAAGRGFAELTRETDVSSEFRIVRNDGRDDDAVLRALHCDLIVSAYPKPDDLPASWSAEHLLLTTGTPVLLVPHTWDSEEAIGKVVLIAWNRSREARRAINDAMPFIIAAGRTIILTVDADRDPERFGDEPGVNLLEHLRRHDVAAEIVHAASAGATVSEVILRQAAEHGADLLVIGAYSRARASELLFGGTTRSLLAATGIPMLIAR